MAHTTTPHQCIDELRAEAARRRLSVTELSRRTGISYQTLAAILRGDRSPRLRDIDRIVAALGGELRLTIEPRGEPIAA